MSQSGDFSYQEAFSRNRGLVTPQEQQRLASSLVAIAGCGGVGGFHAHTFARLGVGRFRLTDPDEFSVGNFNRQIGANTHTVNRNKATVTADLIHSINPAAEIEVSQDGLNEENASGFVNGADIVVDGVDFFALKARRQLFSTAWKHQIPALTAAPLGFSGALLVFARGGMSFDEYFCIDDETRFADQVINFLLGLAPSGLHVPYMNLSAVDPETGRGPSSVIGVQLASCLLAAQGLKLLLGKDKVPLAPSYIQFDAYRQKLAKGRLGKGNLNWKQKLKRQLVIRKFEQLGLLEKLLAM